MTPVSINTRNVDYGTVLGELERERQAVERRMKQDLAQLDAAIAQIRKLRDRQIHGPSVGLFESTTTVVATATADQLATAVAAAQSEAETYSGMQIKDAAEAELRVTSRPMETRELWESIKAKGTRSTAKNPTNTLYTILNRAKDTFYRHNGKWRLTDWEVCTS